MGAAAVAVASFVAAVGTTPLSGQEPTGTQPVGAVQPVKVEAVDVRGNERLSDDIILSTAGIRLGDEITYRDIQDAIHRLWVTQQFSDVKVYAENVEPSNPQSGVRLIVDVKEQPFVSYVDIQGLEHIRAKTVRDSARLGAAQPYDPARVARAESLIRDMLAKKGIRVNEIEHRLVPVEEGKDEYRLVIDVQEGQRVAISEIHFVGNEVFDAGELEGAMSTKEEGFLWYHSGLYDEDSFQADLRQNLPTFYGSHGYIDFGVTRDTLVVDPETGKGRITIWVNEGPKYRLVDFEVRGNRQFPTEDLKRYYESSRGGLLASFGIGGIGAEQGQLASNTPVFNQGRFDQATEDVRQAYRNEGYLYAQVVPFVERTETDSGEPAVRVGWNIAEGEPAYVNRVMIAGNTYTHEDVIRDRIFLLPGDVYNEDLLIQSYRSIMGLGFFETPMPTPELDQLDNGDINVTFDVKEKQTGSVNFGTTVGGWGGIAGFIGYDQPNLFGQAKSGHLRWEFGQAYNNFQASYTDPAIQGSQVSGSVSLFSTKQNRFFSFPEGERRNTGGSLRFGVPFPLDRRFSRVFLGYQLSRTSYRNFGDNADALFGLPPGVLSTISLSLLRNTLDNPMFPTVGTRHELEADLSGGPLGGDGNFQKYTATGQWWTPVAQFGGGQPGVRPVRTSLGLTVAGGAIVGNAGEFPFERFWMGGVQFGEQLRGYDETTITPAGYLPRGNGTLSDRLGNAFIRLSAEYAVRFNDNVSVSLFGDAGNLWRDPMEVNPTRLFRGAGLGVQLVTPFGPMGLDYAYGFDKTEPGWQLHFKFGQTY